MYKFVYENEDEFRQLKNGLKKINISAYKYLIFETYSNLEKGIFLGNLISQNKTDKYKMYELILSKDKQFTNIKLYYKVYDANKIIMLVKIEPFDILLQNSYSKYSNYKDLKNLQVNKDKFKNDLLNRLNDLNWKNEVFVYVWFYLRKRKRV